jgi:hypothetical protein
VVVEAVIGLLSLVSGFDFFQSPPEDCNVDDLVGPAELVGEDEEEEKVRVARLILRGRAGLRLRVSVTRKESCAGRRLGDWPDNIPVREEGPASPRR